MDPKRAGQWVRIFRDVVIVCTATFMLIFETVVVRAANPYIVGAGLTLLGIPPALRLDTFFREKEPLE